MGIFTTDAFAQSLREKLQNSDPAARMQACMFTQNMHDYIAPLKDGFYSRLAWELEYQASHVFTAQPACVTQFKSKAASGNPHDFYSEGMYEWPNPKDPDGPHITRDGLPNPGRFHFHRTALEQTTQNSHLLACAGYYLDKPEYLKKAAHLLNVWFLDKETMMNPHLEYAQAVQGRCIGRGIGIIDTKTFIKVIFAADLLRLAGGFDELIAGLKNWFGRYLTWLTTSKNGNDEKNEGNNHASWWTVQTMAYAIFTQNRSVFEQCCDWYRTAILPQMNDAGTFPRETERTRSYFYSLFNLQAYSLICEMAHLQGVDLWHHKTAENKSAKRAIGVMSEYVDSPFLWTYKQVRGEQLCDQLSLQLGALRLDMPEWENINRARQNGYMLLKDDSVLGPIALLPKAL